jgi:hypothetical protein
LNTGRRNIRFKLIIPGFVVSNTPSLGILNQEKPASASLACSSAGVGAIEQAPVKEVVVRSCGVSRVIPDAQRIVDASGHPFLESRYAAVRAACISSAKDVLGMRH